MGDDPALDGAVRKALERVADRAADKREDLAALVAEGIREGFRILESRQQARWDYLRHCLGTPEGREQLLGKIPDELGYVMDLLNEAEWLLCRNSPLWRRPRPPREEASVLIPYALRRNEPNDDDRDPFQLSNKPTTKGLAALRLAVIHDSIYLDDSILAMAIEQDEDWPIRRELMVLHGVYCREDADLQRLFPVDANPRRIKARLDKWEAMVFEERDAALAGTERGNATVVGVVQADLDKVQKAIDERGARASQKTIQKHIRNVQNASISNGALTAVLDHLRGQGKYKVPKRARRSKKH